MPYFMWRGVDLNNRTRKGKQFATSKEHLDSQLLKRDIALLQAIKTRNWFSRPIGLALKIQFFRQLATLMKSGVLLPDALHVLSEQMGHILFQERIAHIAQEIRGGKPFSQALQKYPSLFDQLMIQIIHVGQESGSLPGALHGLASYLETKHEFHKKLRSAALVPGITAAFFVIIASVIFLFIIPAFAFIFASVHKELPPMTKSMIQISDFLRSWYAILGISVLLMGGVALKWYSISSSGKRIIDALYIRLPFLGTMIRYSSLVSFLQSVALLLEGGMQLLPALHLSKESVGNSIIRKSLEVVEQEVEAGSSFSQAMAGQQENLCEQDLLAIITVGEESGKLSSMLKKASALYLDTIKQSLNFFTRLFQPLLMIVLGLLVTMLIFAVYLPIFNLADIIA